MAQEKKLQAKIKKSWGWKRPAVLMGLSDLITLQKVMKRELKKVKKQLDVNQLAVNTDKTNYVIFHPHSEKNY